MADDLGSADVGFRNSEMITPTIDKFAKEGTILTNYYVQATCTPTRTALMTGKYPHRLGMNDPLFPDSVYGLPLSETLLSEKLKEAGYKNHVIGKWHLGYSSTQYLPTNRYFDSHYGIYNHAVSYYNHTTARSVKRRIIPVQDKNIVGIDLHRNGREINEKGTYITHLFEREAINILDKQATTPNDPFFLYLAFTAPHAPFEAPQEYIDRCSHFVEEKKRIYCGMVNALDESIGKIFQKLKDTGLDKNTLIIFSNDNGADIKLSPGTNAPYRGGKLDIWEGGVRALGIVGGGYLDKFPKLARQSNTLMHVVDWYPTILSLALEGEAISIPSNIDGKNVWKSLVDPSVPSPRNEVLISYDLTGFKGGRKAIRIGEMKLIINPTYPINYTPDGGGSFPRTVLVNLTADPCEKVNIAKENPELTKKLLDRLESYREGYRYRRTFIFDSDGSDPSLRGGFWKSWMHQNNTVSSCDMDFSDIHVCGFDGLSAVPYYGLTDICLRGESVGCGRECRNAVVDFSRYPCFPVPKVDFRQTIIENALENAKLPLLQRGLNFVKNEWDYVRYSRVPGLFRPF